MRTLDEIAARAAAADDIFGFAREVLVPYLDFERARPFLKADAAAAEWQPTPLDMARAEMTEYMAFAWGKVEDHRGLSAGRSVEKLAAWAWLLGDDALVERIEAAPYAQYGAPKLAVICAAFDLPVPKSTGVQRMIRGEPCVDDCDMGCG